MACIHELELCQYTSADVTSKGDGLGRPKIRLVLCFLLVLPPASKRGNIAVHHLLTCMLQPAISPLVIAVRVPSQKLRRAAHAAPAAASRALEKPVITQSFITMSVMPE